MWTGKKHRGLRWLEKLGFDGREGSIGSRMRSFKRLKFIFELRWERSRRLWGTWEYWRRPGRHRPGLERFSQVEREPNRCGWRGADNKKVWIQLADSLLGRHRRWSDRRLGRGELKGRRRGEAGNLVRLGTWQSEHTQTEGDRLKVVKKNKNKFTFTNSFVAAVHFPNFKVEAEFLVWGVVKNVCPSVGWCVRRTELAGSGCGVVPDPISRVTSIQTWLCVSHPYCSDSELWPMSGLREGEETQETFLGYQSSRLRSDWCGGPWAAGSLASSGYRDSLLSLLTVWEYLLSVEYPEIIRKKWL